MKIRCLIVDDEPPAVDELAYILSKEKDVEILGSAGSASKAVQAIGKLNPDLVFLDIQMPGKNGFHVVQETSLSSKPPLFVFATAYEQYAVRAFEENAVDYVLKPFSEKRVQGCLMRVREIAASRKNAAFFKQMDQLLRRLNYPNQGMKKISVEHKGRIRLIDPKDIYFCKAENKEILVFTRKKRFRCYGFSTLGELEENFGSYNFFRTHRSYLANLTHVQEVVPWFNGRYVLTISDEFDTEIPVSRNRVKDFKNRVGI